MFVSWFVVTWLIFKAVSPNFKLIQQWVRVGVMFAQNYEGPRYKVELKQAFIEE